MPWKRNVTSKDKELGFGGFLFGWGFEEFKVSFFILSTLYKAGTKVISITETKEKFASLSQCQHKDNEEPSVSFSSGIKREV